MAFLGLLLLFITGLASAQTKTVRSWTGINGKIFSGSFHRLSTDGRQAEFFSPDGKLLSVAIEKLIPGDREAILNPPKAIVSEPSNAGDVSQFKPVASPNRKLIPLLSPKTFGCSTDQPLVDALWVALLWWDQTLVLEVPKKGDFESKAQWLHKKLTRSVVVGAKNPTAENAKKGIDEYFADEMEKIAACRVRIESKDFSPTSLADLLQGSNAVVLHMSMMFSDGNRYTISSVLESMTATGDFVIHIFGKRLTGRLNLLNNEIRGVNPDVYWEYILDPSIELPDYYSLNKAKFFMGMTTWNAVVVLKPYVYLTPGKIAPIPIE